MRNQDDEPMVSWRSDNEQLAATIECDPVAHVRLKGELNTCTCEAFAQFIQSKAPNHQGWLILNADGLELVSSSGAGTLIQLSSRRKGSVLLVVPPGQVRDLIRFMRLDLVIDTFDTMPQALEFAGRS